MNFSELDFEALEDIPPLRRHYDVPPDLHYRKGNGLDERSLEKRGGCTERISCKD